MNIEQEVKVRDSIKYCIENFDSETATNRLVEFWKDELKLKEQELNIGNVVQQSEQLRLSDFRVGFEYEELQMDSERYLNKGMIWVQKTYGLNSPRLHKIQKLLHKGKLRKA